ncbi:TMEM175 family protein [Caulobacter segnis]|uniref:TMEM175 family protein n=1 Tax=Caulobacter segnis TaxID=88688 RepID=UPI001CBEEC9D|nr:TMEM175 family protein [Caulobacter segnis]UAL11189.1 TMEM175 family protein [Caulobacter segnis]
MAEGGDPDREAGRRLDAFVDAAFAFAVTLLIIASAEPTASIDALWNALGRIPASLGAFALIAMFWLAYREFGRLVPRRDTLSTLNALAIVFTVLVYVFPLRMLVESGFVWISRGWLSGTEMIRTLGDLNDLFRIYGIGFAVLAGLFAVLYLRAARYSERLGVDPADRVNVRANCQIWTISAVAGLVSAALTFGPMARTPWLPGFAYWLIPLAIALRGPVGRLFARKAVRKGAPS